MSHCDCRLEGVEESGALKCPELKMQFSIYLKPNIFLLGHCVFYLQKTVRTMMKEVKMHAVPEKKCFLQLIVFSTIRDNMILIVFSAIDCVTLQCVIVFSIIGANMAILIVFSVIDHQRSSSNT